MLALGDSNKHITEHFLDDPKISCIPDKIGSELRLSRPSKRHVIPQNIVLIALGIDNGGQRFVSFSPACIIKLDIVELCPSNYTFLDCRWQGIPFSEFMQVFLHDDITAARKIRIVSLLYQRGKW